MVRMASLMSMAGSVPASALLSVIVVDALTAVGPQPVLAQPAGLSKPPVVEEERPRDLDSFKKARAKAMGRLELQAKRVDAAGQDAKKRVRAVIDLAQHHWDLAQLCDNEIASGLLEEASAAAQSAGRDSEVVELAARKAEVEQCFASNRQAAVELLSELSGQEPAPPSADEVLFYLAWYEFQLEQRKSAMVHLRSLLEEHPESPFAPEGWLLVGEFYFELSAMEKAVEAYEKVTTDPKNRLYPFALYKLAWCRFNLAEYDKALEQLVKAAQVAYESPHWEDLAREAMDSLPVFYAEVGKPAAAMEFFRKVDASRTERLTAKLALLYSEQGKFNDSTNLCRALLSQFPKSPKGLGYRLLVVRNQGARGDASALVAEFEALADAAAGAGAADSGLVEQARLEAAGWVAQFEKENSPAREALIQRLKAVQERLGQ